MNSPFYSKEIVLENGHAFAFYDGYPVSQGHTLVVPKREVRELMELTQVEWSECFLLAREVQQMLKDLFNPDGFNIGVNSGESAGQTIFHAHIHIIPRYQGDVKNPRGGVRHVIPEKGDY